MTVYLALAVTLTTAVSYFISSSAELALNEAELAEALNAGRIWGYGADVASTEPIRHDNPLLRAKNCYLTPHIAWVPYETRERMLNIVEMDLRSYLAGQRINCVNP